MYGQLRKKFLLCLLVLITGFIICSSIIAHAENVPCLPIQEMTEKLYNAAGERPLISALSIRKLRFFFFINKKEETYTVIMSDPTGMSCIVDSGEDVHFNPNVLKEFKEIRNE